MYCNKCHILMEDQIPLTDEEGFAYPYYKQLCTKCRPSDSITEQQLEIFLFTMSEED